MNEAGQELGGAGLFGDRGGGWAGVKGKLRRAPAPPGPLDPRATALLPLTVARGGVWLWQDCLPEVSVVISGSEPTTYDDRTRKAVRHAHRGPPDVSPTQRQPHRPRLSFQPLTSSATWCSNGPGPATSIAVTH